MSRILKMLPIRSSSTFSPKRLLRLVRYIYIYQ